LPDREERHASLALRSGHGNRLRKAVGWYCTHDRLRTGDPFAMATDALTAYLADRRGGKDALLVYDTWADSEVGLPLAEASASPASPARTSR
jgi:hypothetical protein